MISRRTISERLLVITTEENQGSIKVAKVKTQAIKAKIVMSGKAPEGEHQPEDGDLIQYSIGGQSINIDGVDMTLIHYNQVLYFYP